MALVVVVTYYTKFCNHHVSINCSLLSYFLTVTLSYLWYIFTYIALHFFAFTLTSPLSSVVLPYSTFVWFNFSYRSASQNGSLQTVYQHKTSSLCFLPSRNLLSRLRFIALLTEQFVFVSRCRIYLNRITKTLSSQTQQVFINDRS